MPHSVSAAPFWSLIGSLDRFPPTKYVHKPGLSSQGYPRGWPLQCESHWRTYFLPNNKKSVFISFQNMEIKEIIFPSNSCNIYKEKKKTRYICQHSWHDENFLFSTYFTTFLWFMPCLQLHLTPMGWTVTPTLCQGFLLDNQWRCIITDWTTSVTLYNLSATITHQ